MDPETRMRRQVVNLLGEYGTPIDVLKYASAAPGDVYQQEEGTFEDAVPVTGRGIKRPTKDQLSMIGNMTEVDYAFVFASDTLAEAFPDLDAGLWIALEDEIGFEGGRYRVLSTHRTGKVKSVYALHVVLCATKPGGTSESYP